MNWIAIKDKEPEIGIEVLFYNEKWVDEDFNPNGVRIGFRDDICYTSAYWCNYHEDYHTRTSDEDNDQFELAKAIDQIPTHWMVIQTFKKKGK